MDIYDWLDEQNQVLDAAEANLRALEARQVLRDLDALESALASLETAVRGISGS